MEVYNAKLLMNSIPLPTPALLEAPDLIMPLLLIVLIAFCMLLQHGKQAAEGASWVARLFFAGAVILAGSVALAGPLRLEFAAWGPAKLALLVDPLSSLMFLLVSFLGIVVTRYAVNYLDGDARQATFSRWLVLTLASVMTLVTSSNLLMFTAAWIATSLSLHQLLTFYRERLAALVAARKKFIISRLADACMITALVLVWRGPMAPGSFMNSSRIQGGPHSGLVAGLPRRGGDAEISPVSIPLLAAGHAGDTHSGLRPDACRHHQRGRLPHRAPQSSRHAVTRRR
jgi:NAD(P)H-quinone oxidoreductase subunit 5